MKLYTLTGIVLRKNYYGDSDRLYTIYTRESGKISPVAKGVRKIISRRNPHLDTLNLIKFSVREGRSRYKTIEEVKSLDTFKEIKNDLDSSGAAYYLCELINKFNEEEHENMELFDLLQQSLTTLKNNLVPINFVVSAFEIRLMKLLGYGISLDKCASCGRKFDYSWTSHRFSFDLGGLCCDRCNIFGMELSSDSAELLFLLSSNKRRKYQKENSLSEISNIIKTFTLFTLGQKVKSLELLKKL